MSEHVNYNIRPFLFSEALLYKAIRLEALQNEPGMFGSSYAREVAFSDEVWMDRVTNPRSACLGLFYNEELIGITGI